MKNIFLSLFLFITSVFVYSQCTTYQVYESFSSALPTQGGTWAQTSIGYGSTVGTQRTGTYYLIFNAVGDIIQTPLIASPGVFSFYHKRSGTSTGGPQFTIETSTNGTTWTSRGTCTPGASYALFSVDLGALALTNIYVRVRDTRSSGTAERYIDDMGWTSLNSTNNTLIPAITNCSQTVSSTTTYTFTDAGGSSDTYNNSMSQTFTFSPGTAGMKVEINFSSLVGELGAGGTLYDYIRVYNGPNTSATLIGTYTSAPGSIITSTAVTGELTVTFTSDGSTINAGWVSTVYLVSGCAAPTTLSLTSTSSTAANMSWTASTSSPSSGYEWEIRTSGTGGSGSTGLTASGTVVAGVTSVSTSSLTQNTTYTLYVRSNCGSSTYSSWVASSTMTTPYNPPSNDACSGATTLPCATSNLAGTTVGAISETAPNSSTTGTMGVWYTFTGTGYQTTLTVVQTLDTRLLVLTSSTNACGGTYTTVANIDNITSTNETTTITSVNGTNYYVYIGYYTSGSTTGTFTISRTCVIPPTNDNCSSATLITTPYNSGTVSTATATTDDPGVTTSCGTFGYNVWYKVVGNNKTMTASTCNAGSDFDTEIHIYTGTCGGSMIEEICNDDDGVCSSSTLRSTASWCALNGVTYYISVGNYTSSLGTGNFVLTVSSGTSCSALPVELIYFDGISYPLMNVLKWSTASENNSDYFLIQRSSDGVEWRDVFTQKAAGFSNDNINYSFIDSYLNNGYVYYKLLQYDIDGKFKEYGPISLYYKSNDKKIVKYINLLGQEVDPTTKGIIFEVYIDGTTKKIIR